MYLLNLEIYRIIIIIKKHVVWVKTFVLLQGETVSNVSDALELKKTHLAEKGTNHGKP